MSGLRIAVVETRLRLALVAAIQAGEQLALIGVEEVDGADEVRAYIGTIEENIGAALDVLALGLLDEVEVRRAA